MTWLRLFATTFLFCLMCGALGCIGARTYTFNGVSFPDANTATEAVEAFYHGIESSLVPSETRLPLGLLFVVPDTAYARTNWINVTGNRAALSEDQMQYLAYTMVRGATSEGRCMKNSRAFGNVNIVNALPGTLDPSAEDLKLKVDLVMKKLPSGQWGLGPAPVGPFVAIVQPSGLRGAAYMNAVVLAVLQQAQVLQLSVVPGQFQSNKQASHRQPRETLAVMDIQDNSGSFAAGHIASATEMLRGRLSSTGRFAVIDKSRQSEKLKQMLRAGKEESYQQCYDKQCQIPLGQALAADTILRSTISCLGDSCQLAVELIDLAKEASVGGGFADFNKSQPGLAQAIKDVVAEISE